MFSTIISIYLFIVANSTGSSTGLFTYLTILKLLFEIAFAVISILKPFFTLISLIPIVNFCENIKMIYVEYHGS